MRRRLARPVMGGREWSGRLPHAPVRGGCPTTKHADDFFFFQAEDGIRDVAVTGVQTCALPILKERRICEGCSELRNGSVARGARCGKEACRTVRDDRGGFPACDSVEAELCLPSKAQRAFCAPFPEGESARVDPKARLRRRDRPTPEHALPCRKVRSARPHLFDPLACGDLAAPVSPPTLLWKGS